MYELDTYLRTVLDRVSSHDDDDAILQCECDIGTLMDNPDGLLNLADRKIHMFPYKEVTFCWFRLYTDASIVKALKVAQPHVVNPASPLSKGATWLDDVVGCLDMALIIAGGLGRQEMIHELLGKLKLQAEQKEGFRPSKRWKVNKGTAGEEVERLLPNETVSLPPLSYPVSTLRRPSLHHFQKHMDERKGPVLLTRILDHWQALVSWKKISFWNEATLGGRRLVPVELGRSYVDDNWGQKIMPFKNFMNDHILTAPLRTGYLAQHDLLKQIPSLYSDVAIPDYCFLNAPPPEPLTPVALAEAKSQKTSHPSTLPQPTHKDTAEEPRDVQSNIWFGPAGTISPLHYDPYHNVLCQVAGKKYVRLYSPHESLRLYPRQKDELAPHLVNVEGKATIDMSNTSSIDVAAMELSPREDWDQMYPGISKVPYTECILEAGQALYIPVGWWHYVRSCSVGISVSFWW